MDTYGKQENQMRSLLENMGQICPHLKHTEYCNATSSILKQQFTSIRTGNEIFRAFSQNTLLRKRRGLSNEIGKNLIRNKRGWANWMEMNEWMEKRRTRERTAENIEWTEHTWMVYVVDSSNDSSGGNNTWGMPMHAKEKHIQHSYWNRKAKSHRK